jgi:hypothetical protein
MADLNTIYDDVMELQQKVALLENQMLIAQNDIAGLNNALLTLNTNAVELTADTNLDTLGVGEYIIPSTTISATLVNKPIASTATAHVIVLAGGSAGQLIMYYIPCSKDGASYYQRAFYEGSWGAWKDVNVYDSGWLDLPLSSGVIAFNEEQKPRYRRIGKEVFISGVVKNISVFNTVIATLPVNYRPSKKVIFAVPSTATKFSRISIQTNGVMTYEQSNDDIVGANNWHSVACNYNVD